MSGFITEHMKDCAVCSAPVDTREEVNGGSADGCELVDGRWVCSGDCWDEAVKWFFPKTETEQRK